MVIKWSDFAKINLQNFIRSSKLSSPNSSIEELVNTVYILEDNPRAGKELHIDKNKEIRQLIYKMHRIIYIVLDNEIEILTVLHTNQDLQTTIKFLEKHFNRLH